jgi:hypothetical protein
MSASGTRRNPRTRGTSRAGVPASSYEAVRLPSIAWSGGAVVIMGILTARYIKRRRHQALPAVVPISARRVERGGRHFTAYIEYGTT